MRNLFIRTPFLAVVVTVAVLFATTLLGCNESAALEGAPDNGSKNADNKWDEDGDGTVDNPAITQAGLYKGDEYIGNYGLTASLQHIADDLKNSSGDYVCTISLSEDEAVAPQPLSTVLNNGNKAVKITLVGHNTDRKISLDSKGSLLSCPEQNSI